MNGETRRTETDGEIRTAPPRGAEQEKAGETV